MFGTGLHNADSNLPRVSVFFQLNEWNRKPCLFLCLLCTEEWCASWDYFPLSAFYISSYSESNWSLNTFRASYLHTQYILADSSFSSFIFFLSFFPQITTLWQFICLSPAPAPYLLKLQANFNEVWQKSANLEDIKFLSSLWKSIGEKERFGRKGTSLGKSNH